MVDPSLYDLSQNRVGYLITFWQRYRSYKCSTTKIISQLNQRKQRGIGEYGNSIDNPPELAHQAVGETSLKLIIEKKGQEMLLIGFLDSFQFY